jgi:hypothetical protein
MVAGTEAARVRAEGGRRDIGCGGRQWGRRRCGGVEAAPGEAEAEAVEGPRARRRRHRGRGGRNFLGRPVVRPWQWRAIERGGGRAAVGSRGGECGARVRGVRADGGGRRGGVGPRCGGERRG